MNFDLVAPHYRWLETIAFGNQLQCARVAFINEITPPRRTLIVGEGNGRFLAEFLRIHPGAQVDCVEASSRMIELAQRQVESTSVRFIRADICEADLTEKSYDLVVTHFLLDCFSEETLPEIIGILARAATPDAQWLIADFSEPPNGWRRWPARILLATMYLFFRTVAGIEARRLVDYGLFLHRHGFTLSNEFHSRRHEIRSQIWQRSVIPDEVEESRAELCP